MHEHGDAELMARTLGGDEEAFATIVNRYKDSLVNYLCHLTRDRSHAEELGQEAFVRLYENAANYRDEGKLGPYLYRIATNLYRSEMRRRQRWGFLTHIFSAGQKGSDASPQAELMEQEIVSTVESALAALPQPYRSAVVLRDIEGWSYEEIAVALGMNLGTVKSRIGRGREQLRVALAPYWNGGINERRQAR